MTFRQFVEFADRCMPVIQVQNAGKDSPELNVKMQEFADLNKSTYLHEQVTKNG